MVVVAQVGSSSEQGLFVGCFISMSSTAVVLKSLESSHKNGTLAGSAMVGILICQDMALGVMLGILPTDASQGLDLQTAFHLFVMLGSTIGGMLLIGKHLIKLKDLARILNLSFLHVLSMKVLMDLMTTVSIHLTTG